MIWDKDTYELNISPSVAHLESAMSDKEWIFGKFLNIEEDAVCTDTTKESLQRGLKSIKST